MVAESGPAIPAIESVHPMEGPASVEKTATTHQTSVEARPESARPTESSRPSLSWRIVLLGIWGFGVTLLAIRLAIAYVKLAGLLQISKAVSEEIVVEVARIAAALGCRGAVQVRSSRQYAVPFLYGLRRPGLILPERMCQPAYRGQLPGVIAHELAHVGACDFGWNGAVQAVSILLWFHPLAWRIGFAHRAACDAVCDAISASYLGDVQGYCRTLAWVALDGAASFPVAGLAMAQTCDVRRRIAVLQQRVFAAALGRRAVVGTALIGLLSLALLAGVRLAPAESPVTADKDFAVASRGRVVDARGQGIAGATVTRKNDSWSATTDADGWFPLPELKPGESAALNITATGFSSKNCVNLNRGVEGDYRPAPQQMVVSLLRCATLSGRVLGPNGKPLARAPLSVDTFNPSDGIGVCFNYMRAITDDQGRFNINDVVPGVNVLYYPWSGERKGEVDSGRWKAYLKPGEDYVRLPVRGVWWRAGY